MPRALTPPEPTAAEERALERALRQAFAPLDKRAFGLAVGVATALVVFALTAARLLLDPTGRTDLSPLAQYFYGYRESWGGATLGAAWGFGVGFVAGWFVAFCRNLVIALWVFAVRTRAELTQTRDFLDHI